MFEGHHELVSRILADQNLLTPAQLQAALAEHRVGGKALAAVALGHGWVGRSAFLRAVAVHLGLDYREVAAPSPAVRATVSGECARRFSILPVAAEAGRITVAPVDPFDPNLSADLAFALGCDIRLVVADPEIVHRFIQIHYGAREPAPASGPTEPTGPGGKAGADDDAYSPADLAQMAGETHVVRFVNLVLAQAIKDHASDIHFEPFEHVFKIRYRVDGTLCELAPPPKSLALPIVSRLKVLANLNIAERRVPQDGRIRLTLEGRAVDLRFSTLPTQFGESVVLRVLDQSAVRLELGQIGLPASIQAAVEAVIQRPNGIFIATGPTGSGKTTTLYSCLQALNGIGHKLLTVEDPVEYEIEGIMQVPVNLSAGLTFARVLRTFLRQDPDIVMVGEIRDLETAQIAVQASLTGHLVLTTLHTNDAPGAVTRLVDMGIEPFLLASTLEGVLAQRLVRRICPVCKVPCEPPAALVRSLSLGSQSGIEPEFFRGAGCASCHQTGYKGRLGLFEFLRLSERLRERLVGGASLMDVRAVAREEGMTTLRQAADAALRSGETTIEEVLKYT